MDQPHDRSHLPHAARRRPRRPRPHRPDRARDRPDHRARVAPDLPGPRRRRPLPEPDLERPADHARDPAAHGGQARRECRRHHARPAAGLARLRLHLGHDGDRRGGRVRAAARGPPRGQAHHADHRGLRRVPRLRGQAPRRAHALPRRRERQPSAATSRPAASRCRCSARSTRRTTTAPPASPSPRSATPRSSSGRDPRVDAVFVACTSLRVAEVAAEIEDAVGKPVTSSNHAMAWHALRLARIDDRLPQWGKLFAAGLPED